MKRVFSNLWVVIGIPFGVLVITIVGVFWWYNHALTAVSDLDCFGACDVCTENFVVNEGDSTEIIASNLEKQGLIRSALAFTIYVKLNNPGFIKSGTHNICDFYDVQRIIDTLTQTKPEVETFTIRFIPGDTIMPTPVSLGHRQRIIDAGYSAEEVDAALNYEYEHPVLASKPEDASLEGYIWGNDYQFYIGTPVETIISTTLDALWNVVQENNLIDQYAAHGLSLHEGLTLASIVEKEARQYETMQRVSQIFYNRLTIGMKLQTDASVAYIANQINPGRDKTDMSLYSLPCNQLPWGPWNTYACAGLPPTPIASSGMNALRAVGSPDAAYIDYYYFLTADQAHGGIMVYAKTLEEHTRNKQEYCREACTIF